MTPETALAESAAAEVVNAAAVHSEAIEKSRAAQIAVALSSDSFIKEILTAQDASIATAIKLNVNGKIDKMQKGLDEHNAKHEQDMAKMMPVIEAFEESKRFAQSAKTSGKVILWISGFIVSVGAAWLMIIKVFHS